jgi:hypothetical protein
VAVRRLRFRDASKRQDSVCPKMRYFMDRQEQFGCNPDLTLILIISIRKLDISGTRNEILDTFSLAQKGKKSLSVFFMPT